MRVPFWSVLSCRTLDPPCRSQARRATQTKANRRSLRWSWESGCQQGVRGDSSLRPCSLQSRGQHDIPSSVSSQSQPWRLSRLHHKNRAEPGIPHAGGNGSLLKLPSCFLCNRPFVCPLRKQPAP
ncbi:hypothetical protein K474DRAFT_1150364 [Panus rudis PR-1116 ss-1]|nr:hypothetical protein K474DRAFT_1150364 [Panus rudis PR-1116 ss-1]